MLVSCTSNTIYDKPDDLIPKEKMVELLTDLYIASAAKMYRNKDKERNVDYTFLVFQKHGIDSARFRRSNYYYTTKIDEYEKIFLEAEERVSIINKTYKSIKKRKDSIRRDSITKTIKLKDSIRKLKAATLLSKKTDSLAQLEN